MRKRSVTIDGHNTSVALEDAFWDELTAIAHRRGQSINALVAEVDKSRGEAGNLASAVRLYVLETVKRARRD